MSIAIEGVRAGYDGFHLDDITLHLPSGALTALIGPNGCGKSTLLQTFVGLLRPACGRVLVAGQDIGSLSAPAIARRIALLAQAPAVPPGITVAQLVAYGRAPHQNLLGLMTRDDRRHVDAALERAGLSELRQARVDRLSGGQRQRAFIAMCIAQDTPYILFDEPTSFLDIRYQYEVLDLIRGLADTGRTCIAVLHDIGQAARYADHLVVMAAGAIHAAGRPAAIVTEPMVRAVYGIDARVYPDPETGTRMVTPRAAVRAAPAGTLRQAAAG